MTKYVTWFLFFSLFALAGCEKYYLSLRQLPINASCLASHYLKTPDPRRIHPPEGQKIVFEWSIPPQLLKQQPTVLLHVIYQNYTYRQFSYPIDRRVGYEVYTLVDEEYRALGGLLTYRAEIITQEGPSELSCEHQLWVNLILPQELEEPTNL